MATADASPSDVGDHRRIWRLHALVVAISAAGIACVGAALVASRSTAEPPSLWRLVLLAVIVSVGDSAVLHLRFGRDQYTFTWSEASVILGLVLVPWPWLSIVSPFSVAVVHTVARRDPVKIVFNAASMAVGTTLARICAMAITGGREVGDVGATVGCAALAASACLYFLWNSLTVSAAIATSRGLTVRQVVSEGLTLKIAVLAGNTVVALLLVTTQWRGSSVVLIPFSFVLLYIAYRGYLQAMDERDVWRQLNGTGKEISRLDEEEVAIAAVQRAAQLFQAEIVELAVAPPDEGPVRVVVWTGDGTKSFRTEPRYEAHSGASASTSICVFPVTGSSATSWVVSPLDGIRGLVGSLRLGFHRSVALSERQRQVLGTFVHGVSASLENARLYGQMRSQSERNAYEANHDPLTGLANRKLLRERAVAALASAEREGAAVGLLLIDLDHFKEINDTLGHSAGDQVLCAVARRLTTALAQSDLVARLGGDEFAVLLCDIREPGATDNVARKLLRLLAEPIEHDGLRLAVEGSIGVACYPENGMTVEDLLRGADVAMYQAKQSRAAFAHYRSDRDESSVTRMTLVAELRHALSADEFVLCFQPQIDLETGRVAGVEVLTRWQHATRGLLGPEEFISATEHSGLISEFTLHVLDRAVAECAAWRKSGVDVPVSVNLSARNLLDRLLPTQVSEVLARHDLPPWRLVFELTETTMMRDVEVVEEVLAELRRIGVELSLDDFGTGYSSLTQLQRVLVNEIKIDRSFVHALTRSASDLAIVRATVELAHQLGLRVVAEGVESAEHVAALRSLGCDLAQGWLFGQPADRVEMRELLGLRWAAVPRRRSTSHPAPLHAAPAWT